MIHPDTELRFVSPEIGVGVFATAPIPKGTITWAQDDLDIVITPARLTTLDQFQLDFVLKYCFRNQHGEFVVCWDLGKFVNHSFDANCMGTAWDFEIATRDIAVGEELTDDYGTLNEYEPFECVQENGTARTQALPDDLLRYAEEWDALLIDSFRDYEKVAQPLARYVPEKFREPVHVAAQEHLLLNSIRELYCPVPFVMPTPQP